MHKNRTRLGAIMLLVVMLFGIAAPSQAYVKTSSASIWGNTVKYYFNKQETRNIAAGSALCSTVVSRIPWIGVPVGTACGLMGSIAGIAAANNACVGFSSFQSWATPGKSVPSVFYHNKSYCR